MRLRRVRVPDSATGPEIQDTLNARVRSAATAHGRRTERLYVTARAVPDNRNPRISVVIPMMNEEKNLPLVLPRIPSQVDEIVIVDGGSTDRTRELAAELCPDAIVIVQDGFGKGAALRSGFAACSGDIIVMLDADGSNDPAEIPAFVGALVAGADVAKGSRFVQGGGTADMPLYRRLGNKGFVLLVRVFFGSTYSDLCYGYNAFWADALSRLDLSADGFEIETMMNIRALRIGLRVTEVASFEHERKYGEGRLRAVPDGWRVLKTIIAERLDRDDHVRDGSIRRSPEPEDVSVEK